MPRTAPSPEAGYVGDDLDPELRRMNSPGLGSEQPPASSGIQAGAEPPIPGDRGQQARPAGEMGADRLQEGLDRGAEALERLADRIDDFAADRLDQGGVGSQAADYVYSFTDLLESFARFGRNRDFTALKGDLRDQIRHNPIGAVALSLGLGFLVGKILK